MRSITFKATGLIIDFSIDIARLIYKNIMASTTTPPESPVQLDEDEVKPEKPEQVWLKALYLILTSGEV